MPARAPVGGCPYMSKGMEMAQMKSETTEVIINPRQSGYDPTRALTEPPLIRFVLIALSLLFLGLFLFVPLAVVFVTALEKGIQAYGQAVLEKDALSAIRLTLLTTIFSVVLNTVFGVASAWAITRFQFPGKNLLITWNVPMKLNRIIRKFCAASVGQFFMRASEKEA